MEPDFETALGDLLASYGDTPAQELISALELAIYAIKEAIATDDAENAADALTLNPPQEEQT